MGQSSGDHSPNVDGAKTWRAGTLVYDRRGLSRLFFWLLLGDFAAMLEATALPIILPLQLKGLGHDADVIGYFLAIGYLVGMVVAPATGMWSDRCRSRWGRRRPFILFTMPLNALGMVAIPFLQNTALLAIAVTLISFSTAISTIKYYLFNDVVPGEVLGRFFGAFRFVAMMGSLFFQLVLLRFFDTRPAFIWILVGTVCASCSFLMVLMVREGEYPPPPPRRPFFENVGAFLKEGLGSRYMWMLWLTLGMTALAGPAASFATLFNSETLGMDSAQLGYLAGLGTGIAASLALPCGWLIDRVGPRRIWGLGALLVGLTQLSMFFWLRSVPGAFAFNAVGGCFHALMSMALVPMTFAHLPKEKFGQLTSCQSLISQALFFLGAILAGNVVKWTGGSYRVVFLYQGILYLASVGFLIALGRCRSPFAGMETSMRAGGALGDSLPVENDEPEASASADSKSPA